MPILDVEEGALSRAKLREHFGAGKLKVIFVKETRQRYTHHAGGKGHKGSDGRGGSKVRVKPPRNKRRSSTLFI
jgi:hypothetical protein